SRSASISAPCAAWAISSTRRRATRLPGRINDRAGGHSPREAAALAADPAVAAVPRRRRRQLVHRRAHVGPRLRRRADGDRARARAPREALGREALLGPRERRRAYAAARRVRQGLLLGAQRRRADRRGRRRARWAGRGAAGFPRLLRRRAAR